MGAILLAMTIGGSPAAAVRKDKSRLKRNYFGLTQQTETVSVN
ncbi:MAG TPA: hypothetical protein VGC97_00440 [Pyrinomonadaceae bacterium]|jgi:hypothetical protein